jgi:hypothetical protein
VLATLVAVAALLVSSVAAPDQARAAEPEPLVSIALTSLSPSLPQRDDTITLTGTVTNTSQEPLARPRAYLWRNQAPITDSEGFQQALESAANEPLGRRLVDEGSFDDLYDDSSPELAPGARAGFRVTAKVADLDLSPTNGIYLMGVHVLQDNRPPAVGRARVFVPVLAGPPRNSLQMTSVVTLSSRPSLVSAPTATTRGVFVDDHLAAEIRPGGRLDVLLRAADRGDVSFAVDPALVDEVQTMRAGYEVLQEGDRTREGPGGADAERWLTGFGRLVAERDGYRLLYGSVDVAALAHHHKPDVLAASVAASRAVELTATLPLLVWPGSGNADTATLALAQTTKPEAVLLSDTSTRATAPLLQPLQVGQAPIASYTAAAFAGGPAPEPSESPVHLQQRLLAESWLQASTEPAGTTLGQVRVISTSAQARGGDGAVKAPWIKQTTLSRLLQSRPATWGRQLQYTETHRGRELTVRQLADLDRLSRSWATWQELLVDPASAKARSGAALARLASTRGRSSKSFASYVRPQLQTLDRLLNAIQISVTPKVLTPRSRVSFPITIRNTLPAAGDDGDVNAVRVGLGFESANSQRLTVQPIEAKTVRAGQNLQSEALVDAKTNGTVRVTAQLYTPSGRPVGQLRTIDVTASQAGTVGWFIAIGAGIVLVGTTALRIRQVSRERARAATAAEPEPIDVTGTAGTGPNGATPPLVASTSGGPPPTPPATPPADRTAGTSIDV